jgi:hypothetical protein
MGAVGLAGLAAPFLVLLGGVIMSESWNYAKYNDNNFGEFGLSLSWFKVLVAAGWG